MATTKLARPVRRAIDGIERRGIIITLYPNNTVGLRPKRTRREHVLPLVVIYRWAVEATLEAERRERAKRRADALIAAGKTPRKYLAMRKRGLV